MAKWRKKTNVPYILGGFGCIGVIATTIMAIQSTPKALELLEDAEKERVRIFQNGKSSRLLDLHIFQ